MTDYTWPATVVPSSDSLTWIDNTAAFVSPLSGTTRTESRPGGRWGMSLTVADLKQIAQISNPLQEIEAFLFKLNGKEHRCVMPDFGYTRSGPGGGSPVVSGAQSAGLTLDTQGWSTSTTVLYAGDRIGVAGQMIPITSDATTNGSGLVTLQLAHPLRDDIAHGAAIEITAPTARYILSNKASFAATPGTFKTVLAEFEEAIV